MPSFSPFALSDARYDIISDASKEAFRVSCAIFDSEACILFAITRRIFGSFTSSYSASGADAAEAAISAFAGASFAAAEFVSPLSNREFISRSMILPIGPVGTAFDKSASVLSAR